jgi:uncharacterized protein
MQEFADGAHWVLRLDAGEDLLERVRAFARERGLRAGIVVEGIGLVRQARVGYWDGSRYVPHELAAPHELVGLHGSLATVDGGPSLHLHAALAGPDYRVVGGHLLAATVGALVELYVLAFPGATFGRPLDESLGLRRLDLAPGPAPPV